MLIDLPAERSLVKISFEEPSNVKIAAAVSILTWILILLASLLYSYRKFYIIEEVENSHFDGV
jgi:hypothetical protein